jgi:hypothetical protein
LLNPDHRNRRAGSSGQDSHTSKQAQQQQTKGSWLGAFLSRGSEAKPQDADSVEIGGRTVFRDDAFETNFGRRSAAGGDPGSRLDGDAGIGSSLGTAYALDTD